MKTNFKNSFKTIKKDLRFLHGALQLALKEPGRPLTCFLLWDAKLSGSWQGVALSPLEGAKGL